VAVGHFAGLRDEDVARRDLPRVGVDVAVDERVGGVIPRENDATACGGGDLGE
jgi:hypothetical protein